MGALDRCQTEGAGNGFRRGRSRPPRRKRQRAGSAEAEGYKSQANTLRLTQSLWRGLLVAFLGCFALLAACREAPEQIIATPALWEIAGEDGQRGYLFGTVHALPPGYQWRSDRLDAAFAASDTLVVEVDLVAAGRGISRIFDRLSRTEGLPPLTRRLPPDQASALEQAMAGKGLKDDDFRDVESWAAALIIAQAWQEGSSANGVDLALLRDARGKSIVELEGAEAQLRLFDALPEREQHKLLAAVAKEALAAAEKGKPALDYWTSGNAEGLARETETGLLADAGLREALLVSRNRSWLPLIEAELDGDTVPFIAVGAAHVVGPDGLAAMLERQGYRVKRLQ